MLTDVELTELELFLNNGCQVPDPVDFNSKHDLEAMASALDRLMPACAALLLMYRGKLKSPSYTETGSLLLRAREAIVSGMCAEGHNQESNEHAERALQDIDKLLAL